MKAEFVQNLGNYEILGILRSALDNF